MCGIVGLSLVANHPNAQRVVEQMAERITHRGPDSSGYLSSKHGVAHVGFRRLAIRDLNSRANQPMVSASGRTAIVFNGEVYNSAELSERYLPNVSLRTSGDTEVVLELMEECGFDVLPELNGMFALAIIDMETGGITLVRDRMGKKPLYVYQKDGVIAFSSELRSLKPFGLQANAKHAELFCHFGYFPSPYTFFEDTTQVCPGEVVQLSAGEIVTKHRFHRFTDQQWSCAEVELEELDQLLSDSVRLRRLTDVPLGAFLSGGIDSALVAAHLGQDGSEPIPTFTISFAQQAHNEATAAADTANELCLPHRTIEIDELALADLATSFQDCYEQPYADTSGLVTMLLCGAVKEQVTVALSGDGGDEFFGGYARYRWFRRALAAQRLPSLARRMAAFGVSSLDHKRGRRLARWLNATGPADLYAEILRNWNATELNELLDRDLIDTDDSVRPVDLVRHVFEKTAADSLSQAACFDASYYIPDDLQVKLDRASMQVALEVRCPLLDHRIASMGISLHTESKHCDGLKTPLKRLLRRHVSPAVLNRPKHGFNVPLARWLRGPMRDVVGDTLKRSVSSAGWINATTASRVWQEFLDGKYHYAHSVWMLFSLSHHLQQELADPLFISLHRSSRQQRSEAA